MTMLQGSPVAQADAFYGALANYFSDMRKVVGSVPTGTSLPDIDALVDAIDYSELYRMTTTRYSDSASFENGAAIETIHASAAVSRELALRRKGKLNYYSDAESEFLQESNFYSTMRVFITSMLKGNYVEGRTS